MGNSQIWHASAPPNVEFFIDDVEEPWSFVNPFDFIMIRHMTGSIRDWPRLFQQAYQYVPFPRVPGDSKSPPA